MKPFPILPIGQFPKNKNEDFYINDFKSHIKTHHKHINHPHKHDFFLIVLFTAGSGIHHVDFHSYEIKRGSIFMLSPGRVHHWEFSPDTKGFVLLHSKAFYEFFFANKAIESFPFFSSFQNSPYLFLEPEQLCIIEKRFQLLGREYQADQILKVDKINSLINILYIDLTRIYHDQNPSSPKEMADYRNKFKQLVQLIEQHYLSHKTASDYAAMMHISTRHLNRITQSIIGKTTTELITERILLEAQRILAHSAISVTALANQLGFEDPSYFSRLFKKNLQISPTKFAKKYH